MNAFIWFCIVVLGYAALTVWVVQLVRAFQSRCAALIVGLLLLPVALWLVAPRLAAGQRIAILELLFLGLTLLLAQVLAPRGPLMTARLARLSFLHLVLLSGSALFLIPFVWLVVTSLKEDSQMAKFPPEWIPTQQVKIQVNGREAGLVTLNYEGHTVRGGVIETLPDGMISVQLLGRPDPPIHVPKADVTEVRQFDPVWKNYPDALKFLPPDSIYGLLNLRNTLFIALMCVIGTVLSSSLVAYGFARLRWPGRDWLFGILLATMMLPDAVTMLPRFLIFRSLHWVDTLYPLWVPSFFAGAFNVFLLRQFFMGIPKELEDAARIDGCSYFGTYWRVMMPQVKPALAAVTIMTFIGSWKDFLHPLIYISSPEKMPLSYLLQLYNSSHGGEPGMLMAATTLVVVPVIVLFFFTQRYFIEGVTLTGMGGR
jgi:multiple sugar transport system permease protein